MQKDFDHKELRNEGLPREGMHECNDLVVFRWFEKQISNKKAITACLLVLQGIAYSEVPPGEAREAVT